MSRQGGLGRGLASLIPQKKKTSSVSDKGEQETNYFGSSGDVEVKRFSQEKDNDKTKALVIDRDDLPAKLKDVSLKSILDVPIERISPNPYQPRKYFNEDKLVELADSIRKYGILQPLVVSRDKNGGYELIAGERRLEAAKIAGLDKVPVLIRTPNDQEKLELALIENIQRHNLNVIEEARAYRKLQDEFNLTQEQVAERAGKNRSTVANILRLLALPTEIQKALISGKLSEGHARMLLAIVSPEKQRALFEMILKDNLTVRQVEDKVREVSVASHRRKIKAIDYEVQRKEDELASALGTKVKIRKGKKSGQIQIEFYSEEELNSLVDKLVS